MKNEKPEHKMVQINISPRFKKNLPSDLELFQFNFNNSLMTVSYLSFAFELPGQPSNNF